MMQEHKTCYYKGLRYREHTYRKEIFKMEILLSLGCIILYFVILFITYNIFEVSFFLSLIITSLFSRIVFGIIYGYLERESIFAKTLNILYCLCKALFSFGIAFLITSLFFQTIIAYIISGILGVIIFIDTFYLIDKKGHKDSGTRGVMFEYNEKNDTSKW